ncbi:hypothetical protein MTO96_028714 [Rhipicephalus appendiculatus]
MQADQLYSLEDENSLDLPQIRGMPVPRAIASIRGHIDAIPDVKERLCCVCQVYACLMDKDVIGPWVLYRVGDTQGAADDALVIRYLKEMESKSGFAHSMSVTKERTHMCSLVPEGNTSSAGHALYCLCFWPSLACVAVFRPPEGYSAGQNEVLVKMLGDDLNAFECGSYDDLGSAYQAATRLGPAGPSAQEVEEC